MRQLINKAIIKNGLPLAPNSLKTLEILPGVKESILKLKKLNFICLVVTNQPDVSRGKVNKNRVVEINNFLKKEVRLDDVFVCYHDDRDNCNCRKPKPGMIISLAKKWGINLEDSFLIGDNWKDMESGKAAGCRTILIDKLYNKTVTADYRVENLTMSVKVVKSYVIRTATT